MLASLPIKYISTIRTIRKTFYSNVFNCRSTNCNGADLQIVELRNESRVEFKLSVNHDKSLLMAESTFAMKSNDRYIIAILRFEQSAAENIRNIKRTL